MLLFKCTRAFAQSVHNFHDVNGQTNWDLPIQNADGTWKPGKWKPEVKGELRMHKSGVGYHLSTQDFLVKWLGDEIYTAESSDDCIESLDCVVARSARLTKKHYLAPEEWGEFAIEQAELALELFKFFNYTWDVSYRLRKAINQSYVELSECNYHSDFKGRNEIAKRTWIDAGRVASLCEQDSLSGFLTNSNTRGAMYAAKAVCLLEDLSYPDCPAHNNQNSGVVKKITAYLAETMRCIVHNPIIKQGQDFDRRRMRSIAKDFTEREHPHFTNLPDLAAYNMIVDQNNLLLERLGILNNQQLAKQKRSMVSVPT
jgi:hypothetical protein